MNARFKKGRLPWNKGLKGFGKEFGFQKGHKCFVKIYKKGVHYSPSTEFKKGLIPWNKNKKGVMPTPWNKGKKTGISWNKGKRFLQISRNKHWNWKGGINDINDSIRKSIYFKNWRREVFSRDNWICWICEKRGGNVCPHHLKKFATYPKLRFIISNGLTLCDFCHRTYTNFNEERVYSGQKALRGK